MDSSMLEFYKAALQGAITTPLCDEYKGEWRRCGDNKESLIKLALRQQSIPYVITHCYQGKGLTKEYIKENFGEFINGKREILDADMVRGYSYALYVDFKADCKPDNDVLAFMWCNPAQVEINVAKCPILYVGAKSEIHLVCNGYNTPRIYLFDESKVVIDDSDETCNVTVYKYGSHATVEIGKYCLGKVKIFNKQLKL